jgi:cell division protein FtsW
VWWTVSAAELGRSRVERVVSTERPRRLRRGRGDLVFLGAIGLLVALGILMVFDVTYFYGQERYGNSLRFFHRHLLAIGFGVLGLALASRVSVELLRRGALLMLGFAFLGVLVVWSPLGVAEGGARRWIYVGGVTVQPSEFLKAALVVYLAWSLARRAKNPDFRQAVMPPLVVVAIAGALLLLQPDFGTAVLIGGVFLAMLFVAGIPFGRVGLVLAGALPVVAVLATAADYRRIRLLSFLDPWGDPRNSGFQLVQSLIAFGSGGLVGHGLGESRQKMFYLPAAHTDFIFSVVGEELGLLGALGVVTLFAVVGFRGFRIACKHTDPFARLLAFGLTTLLVLQALVNMAVVLGLLPTKGLPLPFVSYGGSAMVMALTSAGVLYALSRETG